MSQMSGANPNTARKQIDQTARCQRAQVTSTDRSTRLTIALEKADRLEDVYSEAKIRDVDANLLLRLERAREDVIAFSSVNERVSIELEATQACGTLEDQIRYVLEKYRALAYERRSINAADR